MSTDQIIAAINALSKVVEANSDRPGATYLILIANKKIEELISQL